MAAAKASFLLARLERLKASYGSGAAASKLDLLTRLERRRLAGAGQVERLHEVLCFLAAYPDNPEILVSADRMREGFAARSDLRRHRAELADSGIAGTPIRYRFYWVMASWLARHWPECLRIDWAEFDNEEKLDRILYLLATQSELPALDEIDLPTREWIERLKGPDETDAAFLVRRFAAMPFDTFWRERLFEELDVPFRLDPGPGTPSRTRARYRGVPVVYQRKPLSRERPDLRREILRPPKAVRPVSRREAGKLVDLAREAMVTRSRDLDVFANADPDDVRLVDCGGGLQFACYGVLVERRLLLEAVYGMLTLKSGVPIGYVLASGFLRSSEIAFNVFETYREAESARVLGRVLGMVRHLFGADTFTIDPYQLGHDNQEGLESGAWWFYYKLGFRPHDPEIKRLLRGELKKMKANPRHRSSIAALQNLSADNVYFFLNKPRESILGRFSLSGVAEKVTDYLARRFGADREGGIRTCAEEAARLLGVRTFKSFSPGERLAWNRWSPLVMVLPGIERWNQADRKALVGVMRAKGGRRESDYVLRLNRHRKLQAALEKLAR